LEPYINLLSWRENKRFSLKWNEEIKNKTKITTGLVVLLLMIGVVLISGCIEGISWTKYAGNPVLTKEGDWENWRFAAVSDRSVILDEGIYKIWFIGVGVKSVDPPDYTMVDRIGYVTSQDGIHWTEYEGNPILDLGQTGEWDDSGIETVEVIKDGETYMLWYESYSEEIPPGFERPPFKIGYATSLDGVNWRKYSGNPVIDLGPDSWDSRGICSPTVIKDGDMYKMWYAGHAPEGFVRIGYATSTDGANWTKYAENPVLDVESFGSWDEWAVAECSVIKVGEEYMMWYSGGGSYYNISMRIGYATSMDGIQWVKYEGNPVLNHGPWGSWDGWCAFAPDVVFDGLTYHMWYVGNDKPGEETNWSIGYATGEKRE
jgi:predicted GH43/DUF377 family glycosyl hydrolase